LWSDHKHRPPAALGKRHTVSLHSDFSVLLQA
jgi:hypothetical protein